MHLWTEQTRTAALEYCQGPQHPFLKRPVFRTLCGVDFLSPEFEGGVQTIQEALQGMGIGRAHCEACAKKAGAIIEKTPELGRILNYCANIMDRVDSRDLELKGLPDEVGAIKKIARELAKEATE